MVAVLVSATLFGLLHTEQGPVGVLGSAVGGVAFAALRFHYGSLWAPVLAHGFINTIGFVGCFLLGPVRGFW